jgi:hypothetical protein
MNHEESLEKATSNVLRIDRSSGVATVTAVLKTASP